MPRRSIPGMGAISLVVAWLAAIPAASAQRGADRAMELYQNQLRGREKKRQEMIGRIAAMPGALPPPRAVPGGIMIRGNIQVGGELFLMEDGLLPEQAEKPEPAADGPDDDQPPGPVPQRPARHVVAEENFDRWIFRGLDTEDLRRAQLERMLDKWVEQTSTAYRLTPSQAGKLRLAGRGDIRRFFDAVEERRRGFEEVRTDLKAGMRSLQGLSPLIADFRNGPFGSESIFAKTLTKILNERPDRRPPR